MCVRCDCAKPLSSRRLLPIFIRRSFDAVFFALQGSFSAEAWRRCVKLLSEFLKLNPNYVSYNQLASPIAQTRSCRVSASFLLQKFSSAISRQHGGGKGAGCAGFSGLASRTHEALVALFLAVCSQTLHFLGREVRTPTAQHSASSCDGITQCFRLFSS